MYLYVVWTWACRDAELVEGRRMRLVGHAQDKSLLVKLNASHAFTPTYFFLGFLCWCMTNCLAPLNAPDSHEGLN